MADRSKGVRLNCFSPPVMMATLTIELLLAVYTLWRYKLTLLTRLVVLTLLALGVFQLSEYHVCTESAKTAAFWSRTGYVAITLLPPLGLHILHVLAGKPARRLVRSAYATMVGFIVYFLTYHAAFVGYQCTGNYVIFQIGSYPATLYGLYYYGWLITAMTLGFYWVRIMANRANNKSKSIAALILGYFVFLVPTALVNTVKPETRSGIPSIMCGFAVLFALILALYIVPRVGSRRHKLDKTS